MCMDGHGEILAGEMESVGKPMQFQKGETMFLPVGIGRCRMMGEFEALKVRC